MVRFSQSLHWRSKQTWLLLVVIVFIFIIILFPRNPVFKNHQTLDSQNPRKLVPKVLSSGLSTNSSDRISRINKLIIKRGEHKKRLPQCLIIGAKKAGTGALLHFLDANPYIEIVRKELNFFGYEDRFTKGFEWYKSNMPLSYPSQVTIEKTANYFHIPHAEQQVHSMNSSIKLIVILREPVERAISDYVQRVLRHKDLNWFSFEDMVMNVDTGKIREDFIVLIPSYYYRHMTRWLKYFKLEQFLLIDGADLVKNPYKVIHDIESFLSIPHIVTEEHFVFNRTKGFYCIILDNGKQKCMPKIKGRQHPDIDISVKQALRLMFRSHNEQLYKLIGKQFNW